VLAQWQRELLADPRRLIARGSVQTPPEVHR
jgi:hypothetical protein